ncbi:MAG: phage neck terminator protein [Bacillota bacterium]
MKITELKEIIAQIKKDTGIQIVKGNTKNEIPPLPYGIYNVTSPFIKGLGQGAITRYTTDGISYEKRTEQYKFTISFSFFAEDNETTIDRAIKVRQWFLFLGSNFISDRNMAVVRAGNIENRTTFIVDDYEYKHGFDVQFRATEEIIKPMTELIETVVT